MRALLHTVLGLLAFLCANAGIRAAIPWPDELGLGAKVRYFERHADEFDALFVGSSRVFRDIVPRVLERELAREGHEFRAFNLGVGGMEDFEADHVLRAALERRGERLRWVFVETGRWDPRPDPVGEVLTKRTVEWHTLANARNVLEALDALDLPPAELLAECRRHLVLCAMRLVAHGRGPDVWRRLTGAPPRSADDRIQDDEELARNLGWQALRAEGAGLDAENRARQLWEIARSEALGRRAGSGALAAFPVGAVRRQIAYVRARVPGLVYLSLPNGQGPVFARAMNALGVFPDWLAYDRPSRTPSLFAANRRADTNHLNVFGATELTKLLARDLLPRLERAERGR